MSDEDSNETVELRINPFPEDEKDYLKEKNDSVAGKVRRLVLEANEIERELGIQDDLQQASLAALRTYRNSISKNISLLEHQKDKVEEKIKEFEEENDEVIMTIELDIDGDDL